MPSVWRRLKTAQDLHDGLELSAFDVALLFQYGSIEDEVAEQLILEEEQAAEPETPKIYTSDRGNPLVFAGKCTESVLTCELADKWDTLYVVWPTGEVQVAKLTEENLNKYYNANESLVGDHCWNPKAVQAFAEAAGLVLDPLAYDLIVGRWHSSRGTD